jgi:divalent metal cation (Fe/Co/Zn/Cd) transporter
MSVSDLLAVAAILVSILSAVYARYSVSESKRANSIALLAERKQIFRDF